MRSPRKSRRPVWLASLLVLGAAAAATESGRASSLGSKLEMPDRREFLDTLPLSLPSFSTVHPRQVAVHEARTVHAARNDLDRCCDACQMIAGAASFVDIPASANRIQKNCGSRLVQTSVFLCMRVYCDGYHDSAGMIYINATCTANMGRPLPPYDALAGPDQYTDEQVAGVRRLEKEELWYGTSPVNLSEPIVPVEAFLYNAYDTLDDWAFVHKRHFLYGHLMILFWVAVVLFGTGRRLLATSVRLVRRLFQRAAGYRRLEDEAAAGDEAAPEANAKVDADVDAEAALCKADDEQPHSFFRPSVWLRRYVTLPATFGYRCAQDFGWYTVPPRVQSLTIGLFVVLNVVSCFQGYRTFSGNMYYALPADQMLRYVSDRTGIVSFFNVPLIWLFGMRNNALLWLTGWDFGTFNNFHRWVARAATVQAIIHSLGYTILSFRTYLAWWKKHYWWIGEIATILMSLLLGLSAFWLRRHVYEVFLVLHIGISVLIIYALFGHVSIFHGVYDPPIWMCIYIWVGDRVLRVLRILVFNPLFWRTRAQASFDPATNIVRLVVPYSSSFYQPKPGTYYYIHVLSDRRFWESHPFTVASVSARGAVASPVPVELVDQNEAEDGPGLPAAIPDMSLDINESSTLLYGDKLASRSMSSHGSRSRESSTASGSSSSSPPPPPSPAAAALTFLIRPYDGFTARLRDMAAMSAPSLPVSLRVLVDGPYGHSHHWEDFSSLLFVVGGSGVVVPLSHLTGIAARRQHAVHIVWAVREADFALHVLRHDMPDLLDGSVSVKVFVTGAVDDQDLPRPELLPAHVHFYSGRPDVRGEIECAAKAKAAVGRGRRLAVVACGPERMADDARRGVVDLLGRGGIGDMAYFEESFQW